VVAESLGYRGAPARMPRCLEARLRHIPADPAPSGLLPQSSIPRAAEIARIDGECFSTARELRPLGSHNIHVYNKRVAGTMSRVRVGEQSTDSG
jgi:hypothetical protein